MRILPKIALTLLLAILSVPPANSQDRASSHPNRSSFRYIIFNNGLLHNGRLVLVLLDAKSFSEQHLRELFELISKRCPEPDELHVGVFTNLEQIPTPEEEEFAKLRSSETELSPSLILKSIRVQLTFVRPPMNHSAMSCRLQQR